MITANKKLFALVIGVVLIINAFLFVPEVSAAPTPVKIMPLGDSITEGYYPPGDHDGYYEGYRRSLNISLYEAGVNVDFVGSQSDGIGFDSDHEGHSGYTADEIRDNVYSWLASNPAEIVLLHIGTNDIENGQSVDDVISEVEGIIGNITLYNQDVTVLIARIILRSDNQSLNLNTIAYNEALETMVSSRIENGDHLFLVDMEHALSYPADLESDYVHPNDVGYAKMANIWFNALMDVINTYSLTINYIGNGDVIKDPAETYYSYGTVVNLTAEPQSGWEFTSWSGDLNSSSNPVSLLIDDNKTVTATFARIQYKLTLITNYGTTLPSVGEYWYPSGSTVNIEASPPTVSGVDERYSWQGWVGSGTGSYTGAANPVTISINGNITQTAHWSHEYKLTISTNLGSSVPSIGEHWYLAGSVVTVESTAPSAESGVRYVSSGWTGVGSVPASGEATTLTFTLSAPSAITWSWITQYYLTVSSTYGVTGGGGWYNSGTSAYATIDLTTVSGSGDTQYTFSSWGGDASGSSSTSNPIVMSSPKTATAIWSTVTSPTPTPTSSPTSTPSVTATPKPSPVLPTGTPSPTSTPSFTPTTSPSPSTTVEPTKKPQDNVDNLALYSILGISAALLAISISVLWLKKFRT